MALAVPVAAQQREEDRAVALAVGQADVTADEAARERGHYLFTAAGCATCHTDEKGGGAPLAGGRPLATPFGTFFSPNITPDPTTGIGGWSAGDFRRALREGKGKNGEFLFPVFPFTSFTGMSDADIADLYAWIMAQKPAVKLAKPDEVPFPFSFRPSLIVWRTLYFTPGPLAPVAGKSAEWNRGRYLVEAVAHCGECHTPRTILGGLKSDRAFAGNPDGPDGQKAPDITPDKETGIGKWSEQDLLDLLETGATPDGDFVASGMAEVVKGTGALSDADRRAIVAYIRSLPPLRATGK